MSLAVQTEKVDRPVAVVKPTPRISVEKPAVNSEAPSNRYLERMNEGADEETDESDAESIPDYTYYEGEEYLEFQQPTANDQESTLERNYIKMSPSVTVHGVFHDYRKAWQFTDLLAYIDFDQDINVITKHFLLTKRVPFRFVKLEAQNRLKVTIQLVINHEVFDAEFYVIDDFVHRKPVLLRGPRWRNVRHIRLAHNYRENGDHLFGAILGYPFFRFIDLGKNLLNDASLLIQETKLGYIVSGLSKKTDIPSNLSEAATTTTQMPKSTTRTQHAMPTSFRMKPALASTHATS